MGNDLKYPIGDYDGETCEIFYNNPANIKGKPELTETELTYLKTVQYKFVLDKIRTTITNHYPNDNNISANLDKNLDLIFKYKCNTIPHNVLHFVYATYKIGQQPQNYDNLGFSPAADNESILPDKTYDSMLDYIIETAFENENLLYSWKENKNKFNGIKTIVCFLLILYKVFAYKTDLKTGNRVHTYIITKKIAAFCEVFDSKKTRQWYSHFIGNITTGIPKIKEDDYQYLLTKQDLRESINNSNKALQQPVRGGCEKTNTALLIVVIIILIVCMIIKKPVFAGIVVLVASIYYIYHREDACV